MIEALRYRSWETTNTQEALAFAVDRVFKKDRGDRTEAGNLVIIITDGKSMVKTENTIPEAERVRAAKIRIIAVGVTHLIDETELAGISSAPHQRNV